MNKIETKHAPAAIGPYSQGVEAGGIVFLSGQIPISPETGEVVPGGTEAQARQVLKNMEAVLAAAGCDFSNVVKTTVYLKDMDDFQAMNSVYAEYFNGEILPARVAVEAARLPRDCRVEIDAIAFHAPKG